jgi:hypothetical protein
MAAFEEYKKNSGYSGLLDFPSPIPFPVNGKEEKGTVYKE